MTKPNDNGYISIHFKIFSASINIYTIGSKVFGKHYEMRSRLDSHPHLLLIMRQWRSSTPLLMFPKANHEAIIWNHAQSSISGEEGAF